MVYMGEYIDIPNDYMNFANDVLVQLYQRVDIVEHAHKEFGNQSHLN